MSHFIDYLIFTFNLNIYDAIYRVLNLFLILAVSVLN